MSDAGTVLIVIGLVMTAVGVLFWLLGKTGFRGLPGDIRYESENIKIYVPIVTSILLSVLLTLLLWFWSWISRK